MNKPLDPQDALDIRCADAVELVTDYLDKALDHGDLVRFEAHIATCEGCTVFVAQIEMTVRLTRRTSTRPSEALPANFDELAAVLRERS